MMMTMKNMEATEATAKCDDMEYDWTCSLPECD